MGEINFGESFSEILMLRGIKIGDLSNDIGVALSNVYDWSNGSNSIKLSNLVKVANYLQCSISYLIGESTDDSVVPERKIPNFGKQVRKVMKEYGKSTYYLRKRNVGAANLKYWEQGVDPLLPTIVYLAEIIGCSVDHLIGYEK